MTLKQRETLFAVQPRLRDLIALCQAELFGEETRLFGSSSIMAFAPSNEVPMA